MLTNDANKTTDGISLQYITKRDSRFVPFNKELSNRIAE